MLPTSDSRGSLYYDALLENRRYNEVSPEETQFGWAGSARHFRQSRMWSSTKKASSSTVKKQRIANKDKPLPVPCHSVSSSSIPSLASSDSSSSSGSLANSPEEDTMGRSDSGYFSETSKLSSTPTEEASLCELFLASTALQPAETKPAPRVLRAFRSMRNLKTRRARASAGQDGDAEPLQAHDAPSETKYVTSVPSVSTRRAQREKEAEAFQALREQHLMKRAERGSVYYNTVTGEAKVPLYAAPASANIKAAPALSSFAPILPLEARRPSLRAGAIATIDSNGSLVSISRNR